MGPTDLDQQLQQARRSNFNPPLAGARNRIQQAIYRFNYGVTVRDNYPVIPDFSSYNKPAWASIFPYVSAVILRSSYGTIGYGGAVDTALNTSVQAAADNNKPAILYHAIDPGYYMWKLQDLGKMQNLDEFLPAAKDEQWQTFMQAIQYKKYNGLAMDFELYKDWDGKTMGDAWLTEIGVQWAIRLLHTFPSMARYFYSGEWFVKGYAPSLEVTNRLSNTGCYAWSAYYPFISGGVAVTDWSKVTRPPDTFPVNGKQSSTPPSFNMPCTIWQYYGNGTDLNLFMGTEGNFYKQIDWNQVTPPAPPVPPTPDPTTGQFTADEVTKIKKVIGLFNFTDWESVLK